MATASARRPAVLGGFAAPIAALALGVASTVLVIGFEPFPPSTYSVLSGLAAATDLAAGVGLLTVGALARSRPATRAAGLVAMLLGASWLARDWVGWELGPELARTVATLAVPFALPLVAQLIATDPAAAPSRRFVLAAYGPIAIYALSRTAVHDPLLEIECWSNCSANTFLIHPAPGVAEALRLGFLGASAVGGVALAAIAVVRLLRATSAARRRLAPIVVPAATVAAALGVHAAALLAQPVEDPTRPLLKSIFFASAAGLVGVAAGLAIAVAWDLGRRRAVRRLATQLEDAPAPGALQDALGRSLGDPQLTLAYWLPTMRRYVDAAGRRTDPEARRDRSLTTIARGGRPVAVVSHDRALAGDELERAFGTTARLVLDNERLRAEVLARLDELRAARVRIVERGDAARRSLERNLHDGVQQRLLALTYELRMSRSRAEKGGDAAAGARLEAATAQARAALEELRELAHGIHPAILTEAGLAPALEALTEDAPLPVKVTAETRARYPAAVESAAYLVVAEGIPDAARRGARRVLVHVAERDGELRVAVSDDGRAREPDDVHLADRIGALGGRLDVRPTGLEAVLPCA